MLSMSHLIIIFVVVLVVFGPQKLPELARNLGKLMAEFRKASTDFRMAFEEEMRNMERQAREKDWQKSQAVLPASNEAPALAPPAGSGDSVTPENTILPVIKPVAEAVPHSPETPMLEEPVEASSADADTSKNALHDHQQPV